MNWLSKIPPFDTQYSADTHTDAQDCVEESFVHIVYMLTGKLYSARALGYLTKVTPNGSSVTECLAAVAKYGLIPYDLWPTPASFTWESYYSDIPQSVLDQADHYDVQLIDADLNKSPLWTELSFPDGPGNNFLHLVAQINPTQYFDSELGGPVKPLNYHGATVENFHSSIKLTPKGQTMKLENQNGTVFLVGPKGKLGIADGPALDLLKQLDDVVEIDPVDTLPQIGTLTHNDAFVIHK